MRVLNLPVCFSHAVFGLVLFWLITSFASASPTYPTEGAEYISLATPQGVTASGKKVEVIEFFMYHCPACNSFELQLQEWVKKQGSNIEFRRIHVPHRGPDDPEAHLFLTLEAMNLEGAMHAKILRYWHVEHHQLISDEDNIDWAVKNGIDKNQFLAAYKSFSVLTKLHNLRNVAQNYQVTSTPALIIDGRYLTGPGLIQRSNPMIAPDGLGAAVLQVADVLVVKASKSK